MFLIASKILTTYRAPYKIAEDVRVNLILADGEGGEIKKGSRSVNQKKKERTRTNLWENLYDICLTFVLICYTNFPEFFLGRNPPFLFTPFFEQRAHMYLGWSEYRNGIHDSLSLYNYHFFIVIIWPLELFISLRFHAMNLKWRL